LFFGFFQFELLEIGESQGFNRNQIGGLLLVPFTLFAVEENQGAKPCQYQNTYPFHDLKIKK